jgi:recombinational DNA repair protein RecR
MIKGYNLSSKQDLEEIIKGNFSVLKYCKICKLYFSKEKCDHILEEEEREDALLYWRYGKL